MMKALGKFVLSATAFAIVAAALGAAPAYAQGVSLPERVTNAPLPVTVGPVTVANPVTIGSPVTVGNPADNPVLTRDVDNPAEEPFELSLCEGSGTEGAYCPAGSGSYPIPATSPTTGKAVKRFVAEFASGECQAAADTYLASVSLIRTFSDGGNGLGFALVPVNLGIPGGNHYVFAQQLRLYYNPGESVTAGVARVGVDQLCLWSVSGYLVTQ
jgi:hypothetical protein